jgi:hypothetical protein
MGSCQRPKSILTRSSAAAKMFGLTAPSFDTNRSVEIERISSHFMKLVSLTPPSEGEITTCRCRMTWPKDAVGCYVLEDTK